MSDPWNLTLDHSVFEEWSTEMKVLIDGKDVSDILNLLNNLNVKDASSGQITGLEEQLSLCLNKGQFNSEDVGSVLRLVHITSQRLQFLPDSICELTLNTCKQILCGVSELKSSTDLREYFECLRHCVCHLKEANNFQSLIMIFEIIETIYCACSSKTFKVTDELFKHSSAILMAALPIVDQENYHQNKEVHKLLKPLIEIGKFSCKLDAKSMALIWKLVLKTIQWNPELCTHLDLGSVVIFLVNELFNLFDILDQNNSSNVSRLAKVAGFLLKVIIGLVEKETTLLEKEFENESIMNLLVIHLIRFTPDYIRYELPYNNDLIHILELHVSITTHPILENLIKTQRFLSTLAKISATSCSGGYRLNLMRFLGMLLSPTYQSIVEESKSGSSIELLNILFCVVDQAHVEFSWPLLPTGSTNHSEERIHSVSNYELLVTQVSTGLLEIKTPILITQAMAILIRSFFKLGFWAHILACDLLTCIARHNSSQFCLELVQLAFFLSASPASHFRSIQLLNRMIPLLSPSDHTAILEKCPVDKHHDTWSRIKWRSFSLEEQREFRHFSTSLAETTELVKAQSIFRLNSLTMSGNSSGTVNIKSLLDRLIKTATFLLHGLNNPSADQYHRHIEHLLSSVLRVLLSTIQPAHKDQHFQFMQILKLSCDGKSSALIQFTTAKFLSQMDAVASSPQQPALLRVIASLFCEIIGSQSLFVQQCSLRAFEAFLKRTPHAQLASSSVRDDDEWKVKQFLNRKLSHVMAEETVCSFLSSQSEHLTKSHLSTVDLFPNILVQGCAISLNLDPASSSSELNAFGSLAKRPRLENDEQLKIYLSNLSKAVADVCQMRPLPSWSIVEIQEQIDTLKSYL